ncbi:hypothetical protein AGLY_013284 [Aphis glycines]|uniref:Uncharacterized protein n=1 Tax=Aphis glycines TaxID=307491 RepID=A0A6G0T6H7_APHGL|nr:hypothetical protein AGLY_013284 [Aphis glycines]
MCKLFEIPKVSTTVISIRDICFHDGPSDIKKNLNNHFSVYSDIYIILTFRFRNFLITVIQLLKFSTMYNITEFLDEVPDTMFPLREIAKRHSQFGGQGYQKCFCKTSFKTNRCACHKNNVQCSSRCHEQTTCNNNNSIVNNCTSLTAVSLYAMSLKNSRLFGKIISNSQTGYPIAKSLCIVYESIFTDFLNYVPKMCPYVGWFILIFKLTANGAKIDLLSSFKYKYAFNIHVQISIEASVQIEII